MADQTPQTQAKAAASSSRAAHSKQAHSPGLLEAALNIYGSGDAGPLHLRQAGSIWQRTQQAQQAEQAVQAVLVVCAHVFACRHGVPAGRRAGVCVDANFSGIHEAELCVWLAWPPKLGMVRCKRHAAVQRQPGCSACSNTSGRDSRAVAGHRER